MLKNPSSDVAQATPSVSYMYVAKRGNAPPTNLRFEVLAESAELANIR